jgi:hypothetical protein
MTLPGTAAAQENPTPPPPPSTATPPSPPPEAATPSDLGALKKEVAELREQLKVLTTDRATSDDILGVQSDLENFKYQYQRDRETKSALSNRNLLISGLVQTRFAYYSEALSTPVPANVASTSANNPPLLHNRKTTFDVPLALLSFNGLLYRDYEKARNLGFNLSVAATGGTTSNFGAPAGVANYNNFLTVLDANVAYQILPTIENDGDRLSLTLGQQLVPFGLEANTTEELKPVINNALFVAPTGFNLRQIGLIARGEFFSQYDFGYNYRQSIIQAALGIVNGTGQNRDDENNIKDVIARLAITIPAEYNSILRELRVGASYYRGRTLLADATGAYLVGGRRNRYGADFYYSHWPIGLTYEYVRLLDDVSAKYADPPSDAVIRTSASRDSHTATAFYSFGEQFLRSIRTSGKFDDWWPKTYQPFVRYDRYDPDRGKPKNEIEIWTAGLNVFFAETTKAQINGNRRSQQAPTGDKVSYELLAQLQFGF